MKACDLMTRRLGLGLIAIALLLTFAVPSCGQYEDDRFVNLTLALDARVVPAETKEISYYIIPNIVYDENDVEITLECDTFMPPDAISVFEYDDFFVETNFVEVHPLSQIYISIPKVPVGRHIFYIEALGETPDPLACGCGDGMIEAGKKTQIRIRMITDCI